MSDTLVPRGVVMCMIHGRGPMENVAGGNAGFVGNGFVSQGFSDYVLQPAVEYLPCGMDYLLLEVFGRGLSGFFQKSSSTVDLRFKVPYFLMSTFQLWHITSTYYLFQTSR